MNIINLKVVSRAHKLDVSGQIFLKSKMKFKFIQKWVALIEEDMLKLEKVYPHILETFIKKSIYFKMVRRLSRKQRYKFLIGLTRSEILDLDLSQESKTAKSYIDPSFQSYRLTRYNLGLSSKIKYNEFITWEKFCQQTQFNIYDFDEDSLFYRYYTKVKLKKAFRYIIRYNQKNRNKPAGKRISMAKSMFKQKQRFKFFLNLKEHQLRNLILNLKKKKFYILDFYSSLEYRLDMLIYRVFFFPTIQVAQQYIKNFGVYINDKFYTKFNIIVTLGSKIRLSKSFKALTYIFYLLKSKYQIIPSGFLEINYKIFTIIVRSFFFSKVRRKIIRKFFFTTYERKMRRFVFYKNKRIFRKKLNKKIISKSLSSRFWRYCRSDSRSKFSFKFLFKNKELQKLLRSKKNLNLLPSYYPFRLQFSEIAYIFHMF